MATTLLLDPIDSAAAAAGGVSARRDDQATRLREMVRGRRESPPLMREVDHPAAKPAARVIAVTSGKGGVGKTNLAVNLAARFAQAGKRTVLLDADMGLANADVVCGLTLRRNLAHVVSRRCRLDEVLADAPGGFKLAAGATGLADMAALPAEEHERLLAALSSLESASDLILIDTGAGIGPSVLSFTRSADHVLVVTTPEPTAVTDAYAAIKVTARRRREQGQAVDGAISLVVNQARSPAEAAATFARLDKTARDFLGVSLCDAGSVPADAAVGRAVRSRVPFVIDRPRSAAAAAVTRLAVRLEGGVAANLPAATPGLPGSGFFGRLGAAVGRARG